MLKYVFFTNLCEQTERDVCPGACAAFVTINILVYIPVHLSAFRNPVVRAPVFVVSHMSVPFGAFNHGVKR